MTGKYKGVIFDLDGVICSTDRYHYQAWKALADKIGVPFDEEVNHRLKGVSRMDSLEIILENGNRVREEGGSAGGADREHAGSAGGAAAGTRGVRAVYTQQEKEALAAEKNAIYRQLLRQMTPADLPAEVKETLQVLRRRGLRLAIGSSSKNTKMILQQIGLENFFDAVSDGTDITRSKPDPQVFRIAADRLGLKPADCLVVEDAQAGIEAACAGGFDSAGVSDAAQYARTTWPMECVAQLQDIVEGNA